MTDAIRGPQFENVERAQALADAKAGIEAAAEKRPALMNPDTMRHIAANVALWADHQQILRESRSPARTEVGESPAYQFDNLFDAFGHHDTCAKWNEDVDGFHLNHETPCTCKPDPPTLAHLPSTNAIDPVEGSDHKLTTRAAHSSSSPSEIGVGKAPHLRPVEEKEDQNEDLARRDIQAASISSSPPRPLTRGEA